MRESSHETEEAMAVLHPHLLLQKFPQNGGEERPYETWEMGGVELHHVLNNPNDGHHALRADISQVTLTRLNYDLPTHLGHGD